MSEQNAEQPLVKKTFRFALPAIGALLITLSVLSFGKCSVEFDLEPSEEDASEQVQTAAEKPGQ